MIYFAYNQNALLRKSLHNFKSTSIISFLSILCSSQSKFNIFMAFGFLFYVDNIYQILHCIAFIVFAELCCLLLFFLIFFSVICLCSFRKIAQTDTTHNPLSIYCLLFNLIHVYVHLLFTTTTCYFLFDMKACFATHITNSFMDHAYLPLYFHIIFGFSN